MNYNFKENDIINITNTLRLRVPFVDEWPKALEWYQNKQVLYFSEGIPLDDPKIYVIDTIIKMYTYLNSIGVVFFIEIFENEKWKSIGDATLASSNMPIMIGYEKYWNKKIGSSVLEKLLYLAKENHIKKINISIYKYNLRSQNLYSSHGFIKIAENKESIFYEWITPFC